MARENYGFMKVRVRQQGWFKVNSYNSGIWRNIYGFSSTHNPVKIDAHTNMLKDFFDSDEVWPLCSLNLSV